MIFTTFKRYALNKAFTLIELMVVIAIISLLSTLVLNSLASARMRANDTKISEDLRQFRIAAELYYNNYHTYPVGYDPLVLNNQKGDSIASDSSNSWAKRLAFFIKTTEAAVTHNTLLCKNFDKIATDLVNGKYLSKVPVHPYDNDPKGICYKALNSAGTFVAYAVLTSQVGITTGTINKRTGFILGDTSAGGLTNINNTIATKLTQAGGYERGYPADVDGANPPLTTSNSIDSIFGLTSGAKTISSGVIGSFYDIVASSSNPVLTESSCRAQGLEYYWIPDLNGTSGWCFPCPAGLIYDDTRNLCDYPINIP